jgi:2-C-methyl-D-erythritol 4-phosphate cytidylyltransferase
MAASGRLTGAAVLVAAGSGQRLGADTPKAFVTVAGATLLEHAVARFRAVPELAAPVVVAPAGYVEYAQQLSGSTVVVGGATRQASVAAGLAALPADVDLVLVHDVARPFVPVEVIERVLAALADGADAVVPIVAIHDTVRRIDDAGVLGELVDRSTLAAMQTPQGFRREVLADAHARGAHASTTDDAALVQALGTPLIAVAGSDAAFKITTPADLSHAQAMLLGPS